MMKKDWEDIKVSRRTGDKVHFESTFLQNISDSIDYLKQEADIILQDLDSSELKQQFDDIDLEEFSEDAVNQIDDVVCDLSEFKDEVVNSREDLEFLKDSSRNAKVALNRDADYVRRARRKFKRLDSIDNPDYAEKTNLRIIGLCNKAIEVNDLNPEAYLIKGKALINIEKYDEAIEEFVNSLALEENLDVKVAIGDANRLNEDYEDAIDIYDSVLNVDGQSFDALRGKALTYYDMEKFKDAGEFFKKADSIYALDEKDKQLWDNCN